MKTMKLGQEFEIPKTHKETLVNMQESTAANTATINDLSKLIYGRKKEMWEIIKQLLPETKEYNCSYNSETNKVKIILKL